MILTTVTPAQTQAEKGGLLTRVDRPRPGGRMPYTVVRAVRGAESSSPETAETLQRPDPRTQVRMSPLRMDLPYADEVLHLELSDFADTIPASLE